MAIVSRGFSGRRSSGNAKLPPGQYLTTDFPVLVRRADTTRLSRSVGIYDQRWH